MSGRTAVVRWALIVACVTAAAGSADAQTVIDGLGGEPRARVSIFTVRNGDVETPLVLFQIRAQRAIENHFHARVIPMEELFRKGRLSFRDMSACRTDVSCLAKVLDRVDADYLLIIIASNLNDVRLAGARLINLRTRKILGESIAEVPEDQRIVDQVGGHVRRAIPATLWDPYGKMEVTVAPEGAQVYINDRAVGTSPVPTSLVLPGQYTVRAEAEGFVRSAAKRTQVARGDTARLTFQLEATPEEEESNLTWLWLGVSAALLAGSAAALVIGLQETNPIDPGLCTSPSPDACR